MPEQAEPTLQQEESTIVAPQADKAIDETESTEGTQATTPEETKAQEATMPATPGLSAFFPKATRFISRDKNGNIVKQQFTPQNRETTPVTTITALTATITTAITITSKTTIS